VACSWLNLHSIPGLCQLLKRLNIHWKRARAHVHSPDVEYIAKLASVRLNLLNLEIPQDSFLFQDEFTFYRQPTLCQAYAPSGKAQVLAELGWKSNYAWRVTATLNAYTGQVIYDDAAHFPVPKLVKFYQQVAKTYDTSRRIYLAQDNWPVHFHADVLAALEPQQASWQKHLPRSWSLEPSAKAQYLTLPIQLLSLPTYASWTNPIEKLWRWLNQEVIHVHRFADDWIGLRQAVRQFLDQFNQGSTALLRYVGLSHPARIYHSAFPNFVT